MKENFLSDVGQRIHTLRKELSLSQEELAEKADMSKQTVSVIENGKREILASNITKMADALYVSTDYLLKGTRTDADHMILDKRVRDLTDDQYMFLKGLIGNFIEYCAKTK